MSLREYEKKRHFDATPEPPPVVSAEAGHRFCVQRHHATRLHYDFRLEHDGVLKSWAVPRGPSLDPKNKRQAAHVEDHPVDYLTFEGVIPHGNYGAGSVMLWDLGTYAIGEDGDFDKQYERGNLKLIMEGQKLKGAFAFVRMQDGKSWLLIKKKDPFAVTGWDVEDHARSVSSGLSQAEIARGMTGASWSSTAGREPDQRPTERPEAADLALPAAARTLPMPRHIDPMLPFACKPFSDPHWMFELKWDGVRAIAYITDQRVTISSRRGNPIVRQYPELEALHLSVAAQSCVLDGEIVALDEHGVPQFERLQPRMHASVAQALTLSRRTPVTYYVFDVLYLNGHDLRALPFKQRRELLKE
ncbi:MAG TPA: DNA polymerase ligase N-terminal domain-containing protein, partial [Candidatus Xenobia bacterium]